MNLSELQDLNQSENKIVTFELGQDANQALSVWTSPAPEDLFQRYSRMKFGDVAEVRWWAHQIAKAVIDSLQAGGSMLQMFEQAKARKEQVYILAPGVRNVISASNHLMREAALQINVWLCQNKLPTMVIKSLTRLGSGRSNYAELGLDERQSRSKSTQTLIPRSDYEDRPVHVVFLDDVEITGSTLNRAKNRSLAAGALSFQSILGMRVDPELARVQAGIEHELNHFAVGQSLDGTLAKILSHAEYQPVQRMLRLLLDPGNRVDLPGFAMQIPISVLGRIYAGAMANNYLWIKPEGETQLPFYQASLLVLKEVLIQRNLLDANGLLKIV